VNCPTGVECCQIDYFVRDERDGAEFSLGTIHVTALNPGIFADGFETGDLSQWSEVGAE
jgi:hypothetical protein